MSIGKNIIGAVITIVIGGTAYTVTQADVAKNLADETGMSQQQAQEYVESVKQEDLVPYDQLGSDYIKDGQDVASDAATIDCVTYQYDWESPSLTCEGGKSQLQRISYNEIELGRAYQRLGSSSANKSDMLEAIRLIDVANTDYDLPIVGVLLDAQTIADHKNANSYNRALIKAVVDGE